MSKTHAPKLDADKILAPGFIKNTMKRHFVATGYVVRDDKTLLLFHKKLKMWLPPGGHMDEGELPEETVRREILEETGLEVEIISPHRTPNPSEKRVQYLYLPNHMQLEDIPGDPPHQHIDLIFYCLAKDGKAVIRPEEHDHMRWYSINELESPELEEEVRVSSLEAIRHVMRHKNQPV
jgi:ADP-ribose pyrophosphatase YjhB (NUDIX family)